MSKGVPFDVAFSLDDNTCLAWVVMLGIQDGGQFDWSTVRFIRQA